MKKSLIPILLLLSFSLVLHAQSSIGQKAPDIVFNKMLNSENYSAKLSDFNDKIVIIDYWATWCSPCVESLTHLDELQNNFKNNLQIITITEESEERIKAFLSKRQLSLPIVIDDKRELSSLFPHRIIPHTVVIDKSGIIRAITTTTEITNDYITGLINNKEVQLTEKKDMMDFDRSKPLSGNENFSYQVTITPYQDGLSSYAETGGNKTYKNRRLLATNYSIRNLYEMAYKYPTKVRTIIEVSDTSKFVWSKQNAYCFDLIVPEELGEKRFEIMKQQLDCYFGYKTFIEKRIMPVKVLQKIIGVETGFQKSKQETKSFASFSGSGLSMINQGMNILITFLQSQLRIPILDETKLNDKYDLDVPYYNENPDQIYAELNKLGLQLIDENREIEVLVIRDK